MDVARIDQWHTLHRHEATDVSLIDPWHTPHRHEAAEVSLIDPWHTPHRHEAADVSLIDPWHTPHRHEAADVLLTDPWHTFHRHEATDVLSDGGDAGQASVGARGKGHLLLPQPLPALLPDNGRGEGQGILHHHLHRAIHAQL